MYGYGYNGPERKAFLPADAIVVDPGKGALRINICRKNGYVGYETVTHEFELLRHSVCQKCKSIVSAYALGSIGFFEEEYEASLFGAPWGKNAPWKMVQLEGAFALFANDGHKFELDRNKCLEAQCHCKKRELAG
jgi:hypothetical protein